MKPPPETFLTRPWYFVAASAVLFAEGIAWTHGVWFAAWMWMSGLSLGCAGAAAVLDTAKDAIALAKQAIDELDELRKVEQ